VNNDKKSENNLSTKGNNNHINDSNDNDDRNQLVILSRHLSNCLFHDNEEILLESARALGNLTRNHEVTRSLIHTRSDEALLLLLGHPRYINVYICV
jgi:hypothetical protein